MEQIQEKLQNFYQTQGIAWNSPEDEGACRKIKYFDN